SNVVHPQLVASEMLVVGKALGELFKVWLVVALATGPTVVAEVGPDPRKVDTSGASYAAVVSIAEVSASKTSGARRLHQECRLRV
ncbi:hypothetical protein ACL1E9_13300, partial [Corynebacterium striatum]